MMGFQGNPPSTTIPRIYYAATALFLLLDVFLGINVRLASLDALPGWRAAYYVVCFVCLALIVWRPAWSTLVATSESLVTLSMLIITMGARVMTVSDQVLHTGEGIVTAEEIANFVIAGGAAWLAYTRGFMALRGETKRR